MQVKSSLLSVALVGGVLAMLVVATPGNAAGERASKPLPGKSVAVKKTAPKKTLPKKTVPRKSVTANHSTKKQRADQVARQARSVPVMTPLRAITVSGANLSEGDAFMVRSGAALVLDQATGELIFSKNADVPTSIASITKLMTAMVTLDARLPMEEEIVINSEDIDRLKGTGSRLALGTRLTREELLHLALIASENRAASALARTYPGGNGAFIAAMNRKAREIGMRQARFMDATGLHSGNKATAADLAKLVDAAYRYALIRAISTTASYDISVPGTRIVRVKENGKVHKVKRPVQRHIAFNNTNRLIREGEWEIGISKTGFIREAGHCLVMQTRIGEQPVIIVLLDAVGNWSRLDDAARIRQWLEQGETSRIASSNRGDSV